MDKPDIEKPDSKKTIIKEPIKNKSNKNKSIIEKHTIKKSVIKKQKKWAIILAWVICWQLLALAVGNGILLAGPIDTVQRLVSLLGEESFFLTVSKSFLRIAFGFTAGFLAAVLLAAGSRRFPLLEEALAPVMSLLKAVPVASFVVLLLVWWGSSVLAVAVCFLVVLPNLYVNTLEGLKSADPRMLEMAKVFCFPLRNCFFYIYRPALRPFLYSGMKVSLGMCWKSGVAAEVIGMPDFSIGGRIYLSKVYLDTAGVLAWTAVVILLSVLFEKLVLWFLGLFFAWEPVCRRPGPQGGSSSRKTAGSQQKGFAGKAAERKETGTNPEIRRIKACQGKSGPIRLTGIAKSYDGQSVLKDFNAVYEEGETYYLTSPSGSGKTTLLHILAGVICPDEGQVSPMPVCSMVFQEDRLCEDYSAVKNVELVTGDAGRAREALRQLLGEEALHKPCRQLSGGMRRRVALVRAMEACSDCVLLDEPFTGMDLETRSLAEDYLRKTQKGRTLIIATHS